VIFHILETLELDHMINAEKFSLLQSTLATRTARLLIFLYVKVTILF